LRKKLAEGFSVEPLAGDASGRQYSRLVFNGGVPKSVVMMDVHAPINPDTDDWLVLRRFLDGCGVPVPGFYFAEAEKGLLYIEDCGNEMMENRVRKAGADELTAMYRRALDILLLMQGECTRGLDPKNPAAQRKFDAEKYLWELNHTATHYIKGYCRKTLSESDGQRLDAFFHRLIAPVLDIPAVFSHRDYHSRNLMLKDNHFYVIDFQDARLGPPQYDLASLLFDSYAPLTGEIRGQLLEYYLDRAGKSGGLDREQFIGMFHRVGLQRNIKALGTFGYQATARNNNLYAQFMPDTVGYVRRNIRLFKDLAEDADWVLSLLLETP
jgi:hypothetical protein